MFVSMECRIMYAVYENKRFSHIYIYIQAYIHACMRAYVQVIETDRSIDR